MHNGVANNTNTMCTLYEFDPVDLQSQLLPPGTIFEQSYALAQGQIGDSPYRSLCVPRVLSFSKFHLGKPVLNETTDLMFDLAEQQEWLGKLPELYAQVRC